MARARRLTRDTRTGRRRVLPWAVGGAVVGALLAAVAAAPARWLADAVADASGQRLLLADARGSVWSGSAVAVLAGGPGSRSASALPGRLKWTFGLAREDRSRVELRLRHECCIDDQIRLRIEAGVGRLKLSLPAGRAALGRWPASWLVGLGAPFNSLRPGGTLRLVADGLAVETVQGRWRVSGLAELDLQSLSSPLSTADPLGSYRISVTGASSGGDGAGVALSTLQGPLRLTGTGQWAGPRLRFRGQAQADPGSEAPLNTLLNLLGPRQGALALLAIG